MRVVMKKRDLRNMFRPLWEIEVDPRAALPRAAARVAEHLDCVRKWPPSRKVDLLLISDGYSSSQAAHFAPTP